MHAHDARVTYVLWLLASLTQRQAGSEEAHGAQARAQWIELEHEGADPEDDGGDGALPCPGSGRVGRCISLRLTWPGEARSRPADGRISVSRNSAPIPDVDKSVRRLVVVPSEHEDNPFIRPPTNNGVVNVLLRLETTSRLVVGPQKIDGGFTPPTPSMRTRSMHACM